MNAPPTAAVRKVTELWILMKWPSQALPSTKKRNQHACDQQQEQDHSPLQLSHRPRGRANNMGPSPKTKEAKDPSKPKPLASSTPNTLHSPLTHQLPLIKPPDESTSRARTMPGTTRFRHLVAHHHHLLSGRPGHQSKSRARRHSARSAWRAWTWSRTTSQTKSAAGPWEILVTGDGGLCEPMSCHVQERHRLLDDRSRHPDQHQIHKYQTLDDQ
eukprot:scaffold9252_cov34-Tisochrysis_lutea.AAC.6